MKKSIVIAIVIVIPLACLIVGSYYLYTYLNYERYGIQPYTPLLLEETADTSNDTVETVMRLFSDTKYSNLSSILGRSLTTVANIPESNIYVANIDSLALLHPSTTSAQVDSYLMIVDKNDQVIGLGVLYSQGRSCFRSCDHDNPQLFTELLGENGIFNWYLAEWISQTVRPDEFLLFAQSPKLGLTIIQEEILVPSGSAETGFIVTNLDITEIAEVIYGWWRSHTITH